MSKEMQLFSEQEKNIIIAQYFPQSATQLEIDFCLSVASELGLNPITKEIWFIERKAKVNNQWITKIEPMVGRDSFLKIAHRSGDFEGIETKSFIADVPCLKNGNWEIKKDLVSECKVWKKGFKNPFVSIVNYSEYVQKTNQGQVTKFWNEKPHTMLKKVAESQALRKAFNISGVYDDSEYNRDDVIDTTISEITSEETEEHKNNVLKLKLSNRLKSLSLSSSDIKEFATMFNLNENIDLLKDMVENESLLIENVERFESKFSDKQGDK